MNVRRRTGLLLCAWVVALASPAAAAPSAPAGPEVRYSDAADDAYWTPGSLGLPNPLLSEPALDIREVGFAPDHRRGQYVAAMTFSAAPTTGSTYVSTGYFRDKECQMYHFLRLAQLSYATLFCGTGADRRHLQTIWGGQARVTGSTLSATFSNRSLPAELEDEGSSLTGLFSWSCPAGGPASGNGCVDSSMVDVAQDPSSSYQLRRSASS